MPYLIETRTDIPNGLLQTLDLGPYTSIREDAYQPVGQTGYRSAVVDGAVSVTAGVFGSEGSGLVAWIVANVSMADGTKADCLLTPDTFANSSDGETFTIDDGENVVVFEYLKTAGFATTGGNTVVSIIGATTAADITAIMAPIINASLLNVTATDATGTVTIVNDNQNQPTADQNNTGNAETMANAGALTAWANATDSASMSADDAAVVADDIVGIAPDPLDHASILGEMSDGAINKEDVAEILALLTGAVYTVPAGTDVGTTAFINVAVDDSIAAPVEGRHVYDSGKLRISFAEGRLSKAVGATFNYAGVTGAALAVYNDDGTAYTG
jgi:hypothetical protein